MASTIVSPEKVIGRLSEWYRLMTEAGLKFDDLQTPISDADFRSRLVRAWKAGAPQKVSIKPTPSHKQAKSIMGRHYVSLSQAARFMKIDYMPSHLERLAEIPFSVETLTRCRDSHILFPGYCLTRLHMASRFPTVNIGDADGTVAMRWYLVSKDVAPGTNGLNLRQVEELLAKREASLPNASEIIYLSLLWWQVTGEYFLAESHCPYGKVWVWCSPNESPSDVQPSQKLIYITMGMDKNGIHTKRVTEGCCQERLMAIESVNL